MKWLDDFKNAYNGWSRSTQLIAMGVGLILLFSTGLFPVFALVYVVWIGKNWWDRRQAQKSPGLLNGNLTPQPPVSPPTAIPPVIQPTQSQVPPSAPPPMPPASQPNRPTLDWDKP